MVRSAEKPRPSGVILSGGRGVRFFGPDGQGDKALLDLNGKPLALHVADALRQQVSHLALNANGDADRFAGLQLPVIGDTIEGGLGPLAGILSAMLWARTISDSASHVVTVPADTPFIPSDLVQRLANASSGKELVIAAASSRGQKHHAVALWPVALAGDLTAAIQSGVRAIAAYTDRHEIVAVDIPDAIVHGDSIDPFFNINKPADLTKARQLLYSP